MKINEPQTAMTADKLNKIIPKGKKQVALKVLHVTDDRNDRKQHALVFDTVDDRLYLNITNLRAMIAKFGDDSDDWIGEDIELYIVNVDVDGELRKGVRVK